MIAPLLLVLALASTAFARAAEPIVDVGYAAYLGNASTPGVHFFGGIRYAQPPLGDLRWRAPALLNEAPRAHKNVTDARTFGEICVQQPASLDLGSDGMCGLCVARRWLRQRQIA
jgi:hypothetical protein